MNEEETVVETPTEVITDPSVETPVDQTVFTADSFFKEYQSLCERSGFQLAVNPTFVPTNHGSFEVTLQTSVVAFVKPS